jgi:NADH-quinone oxidoreductase subunit G
MREGLDSADLDSCPGEALPLELRRALVAPELQAKVPDIEFAHTVFVLDCDPLEEMPIVDLRIRKGVRRNGVRLMKGSSAEKPIAEWADALGEAGPEVVILYPERLVQGPDGTKNARALLELAQRLGLAQTDGAGLLEIPASANGRGLREAGMLPNAGPNYSDPPRAGRSAPEIARALSEGELTTLYLMHSDPLRSHPDRELWERALHSAAFVIAHESQMTDTVREHADVVFPADMYAEKDGTVTHPHGLVQRLRPAIGRPPQTRSGRWVLTELGSRVGLEVEELEVEAQPA